MLFRCFVLVQIILLGCICFADSSRQVILSAGIERYPQAPEFNQNVYGISLMGEKEYFFGSVDGLVGSNDLMQATLGFGPKLGPVYFGPAIGYSLQTLPADNSHAKERIQTLGILGAQAGVLIPIWELVIRPNVLWCQRSLTTTVGLGFQF